MKSHAFNTLIAEAYTTPLKTVTVYARLLKEAGLLTSGARGRNAPDMKPLDAARLTLAMLTTDSPAECVERVQRFGKIKYSPRYKKTIRGYETIQPDHFGNLFHGETLEDVLSYVFSLPALIGVDESCKWFDKNVFHLRVSDFEVLAELFQWKWDGNEVVGDLVVPFKGEVMVESEGAFHHVKNFATIKGGIRSTRLISGTSFLSIGIGLLHVDNAQFGDAE